MLCSHFSCLCSPQNLCATLALTENEIQPNEDLSRLWKRVPQYDDALLGRCGAFEER